MSDRPKLVYVVALPLVTYVVLTTLWLEWGNFEGAQLVSMVKHLVVVLLLVASLFFDLRVGCWATLAWCAFVPLERYGALFSEFSSVAAGGPWSLAGVDVCSNSSAIHCVPALGCIGIHGAISVTGCRPSFGRCITLQSTGPARQAAQSGYFHVERLLS